MLCDHKFVKRNINPSISGNKPHIVWICKYCGTVSTVMKNNRNGSRYRTRKGNK